MGSGGCFQLLPGDLCPRSGMLEGVKQTWWCFPIPRCVLQPLSLQGKLLLETLIQLLELAVVMDCPSSTPQQGGKCDNISLCEITALPVSPTGVSEPSLPPSPSLRLFLGSQHEIFLLKTPFLPDFGPCLIKGAGFAGVAARRGDVESPFQSQRALLS